MEETWLQRNANVAPRLSEVLTVSTLKSDDIVVFTVCAAASQVVKK